MLCAICGAMNSETAPRCGRCGTSLTDAPAQSWFAPVAHSPFNDEPLPQPSDPLPRLQPAGEISTFAPPTPPEHAASLAPATPASRADVADYPTQVSVPVPSIQTTPPTVPHTAHIQQGTPPSSYFMQQESPSWSGGGNYPGWQQEESYAAMRQTPPTSQPSYTPAYAGSQQNGWQQEESYAAMYQAPPASPAPGNAYAGGNAALGNVYPGVVQNTRSSSASTRLELAPHPFVQPWPLWKVLLSSAAGTALLIGLVFLMPDWATGALIAGVIALFGALLLLVAGGVRVALGMLVETNPHRQSQVISSVLLVLLLFLATGVGLTQQASLHAMQARALESHQNWQMALDEYRAAGETAPASANLARLYNEWGEDLSKQQHYAEAVARFSTVLQSYTQVPDQLPRARANMLTAYLAWGDAATQQRDYAGATSHYDTLLALGYCDPGCQNQAGPKDASAYAHLAGQQLDAQQFASAVHSFAALTTRFASSPETKQAHADYAKALWGQGQQQLNTTCSDAVKTYQQLGRQFGDTQQGQQAASALQQPVTVKGHFTSTLPGSPYKPTVALVQGLTAGIQQYQFPPLLRKAPMVQINSDGTFTFTSVPQGTYELVWSNDGTLHFYYAHNGSQVLYTTNLGPLCTYDYGDISETIPTTTN